MNALGVSISISLLFLKFIVTYEGYMYVMYVVYESDLEYFLTLEMI